PHVPEDLVDVALEHADLARRDRATHEREGVYGEERVEAEPRDVMAQDEALHLQPLVLGLVPDPREALGRRAVVRELEDAAEKDRDVLEADTRAPLELREDEMAQVCVRAAEVEVKLGVHHAHHVSAKGRISS